MFLPSAGVYFAVTLYNQGRRINWPRRRCIHARFALVRLTCTNIRPVEELYLEVNVQIQRATEALDRGDRTRLRLATEKAGLLNQVHGDALKD